MGPDPLTVAIKVGADDSAVFIGRVSLGDMALLEFAVSKAVGEADFDVSSTFGLATGAGTAGDVADVVATKLDVTCARLGTGGFCVSVGFAEVGAGGVTRCIPLTNGLVADAVAGTEETGGGTARLISSISSSRPRVSGLKRYPETIQRISAFPSPVWEECLPLRMEVALPSRSTVIGGCSAAIEYLLV
jgi:hypothetical protein